MKLSDVPSKITVPFATLAGVGYISAIPTTPSGTPGRASFEQGFPPENFNPVSAGGVPPFGQDFNGLHNQETGWNRWQATGRAFLPYDASFQTAVGGYPRGSIVESLVENLLFYVSTVDDNVTNPDNGGAGWLIWSRKLVTNTDLYVNGSTGNDANNGLSPATAKQTISAAVTTAWTFPPSQYTITIHVADGTYNESVYTPTTPGPAVVITGNSTTPSNVVVQGVNNKHCFAVVGPNFLTVEYLKVITGTGTICGFASIGSGASLTTRNTVSGACAYAVHEAYNSASLSVGSHTYSGNSPFAILTLSGGNLTLSGNASFVISTPITLTAWASAGSNGTIGTTPPPQLPTFTNAGNATCKKYEAYLNGVITSGGAGVNYFPGGVAGTTATGGQYQ